MCVLRAGDRTLYLGKNGDTLQIDGEGPEDLHGGELVVEHQGEQRARTQQEFDPECTSFFLLFSPDKHPDPQHCSLTTIFLYTVHINNADNPH
jgi:hypothetical protein